MKTILSKKLEFLIYLFLEIVYPENFFCKILLRTTFYKLLLWIIFFKYCKLSSQTTFRMSIVDHLFQILQIVVPNNSFVFQDTCCSNIICAELRIICCQLCRTTFLQICKFKVQIQISENE